MGIMHAGTHTHSASTGHKSNKSSKLPSPFCQAKMKHIITSIKTNLLSLESQCCICIKSDLSINLHRWHELEKKDYEFQFLCY